MVMVAELHKSCDLETRAIFRDMGFFLPRQLWHWGLAVWAGSRERTQLWLCSIHSKGTVKPHAEITLLEICWVQGEAKSHPGRAERGHMQVALTAVWELSSLKYQVEILLLSPFLRMCLRHAEGYGQVLINNCLTVAFIVSADLSHTKAASGQLPQ